MIFWISQSFLSCRGCALSAKTSIYAISVVKYNLGKPKIYTWPSQPIVFAICKSKQILPWELGSFCQPARSGHARLDYGPQNCYNRACECDDFFSFDCISIMRYPWELDSFRKPARSAHARLDYGLWNCQNCYNWACEHNWGSIY